MNRAGVWRPPSPHEAPLPLHQYIVGSGHRHRWPVKTLSDKSRTKVDFTPKSVRIDRLRNLTAPSSLSTSTPRIKGVEFKTYRLKVRVMEAKIRDALRAVIPALALTCWP